MSESIVEAVVVDLTSELGRYDAPFLVLAPLAVRGQAIKGRCQDSDADLGKMLAGLLGLLL